MNDDAVRAALERHWSVSGADDPDTVHEIYRDDVVVEYPQSGERIVGTANLQALREAYPAKPSTSAGSAGPENSGSPSTSSPTTTSR